MNVFKHLGYICWHLMDIVTTYFKLKYTHLNAVEIMVICILKPVSQEGVERARHYTDICTPRKQPQLGSGKKSTSQGKGTRHGWA